MLDLKNICEAMISPIPSIPAASEQLPKIHVNSNSEMSISVNDYVNSNQLIDMGLAQGHLNSSSDPIALCADTINSNLTFEGEQQEKTDFDKNLETHAFEGEIENSNESITQEQFLNASQEPFYDASQEEFYDAPQEQFYDASQEQLYDVSQGLKILEEIKNIESYNSALTQGPNEPIYVDIESDDSMHSWRPNLNSTNQDCNFFFPYRLSNDNANTENINVLNTIEEVDSQSSLETYWEKVNQAHNQIVPITRSSDKNLNDENDDTDLQSQLHCQKVRLNILKHELAKAKLELHKWKDKIRNTEKINETFFPIREMMLLNEENAELRSECHKLCLEVDFYVKEKAPLGEVNEEFYKANGLVKRKDKTNTKGATQAEVEQSSLQEPDEANTWACSGCTFKNHPDINSCEICQTQRKARNTRCCLSSHATCYCHPNEESISISS